MITKLIGSGGVSYILAGLVLALGLLLSYCDTLRARNETQRLQIIQAQKLYSACLSNLQKNKAISDEYQNALTTLDDEFNSYRRMFEHERACISIEPAGRSDAPAAGRELSRPHGVPAQRLLEFGRDAEKVRLRLLACQKYINELKD